MSSANSQSNETRLVLRPLIGLMNGQSQEEIERYCLDEMAKYRGLRDLAVRFEAEVGEAADAEHAVASERAYVSAMIAVHAQHTVVSTLIDILGYIPTAEPATAH